MGTNRGRDGTVGGDISTTQQPAGLLGLRACGTGLRHAGGPPVRVCAAVGFPVFFVYLMRRVDCRRCGVKVESVPWAEGKQTLTRTYMQFLAGWARRMSWQEVADIFRTSWEKVFRSVEWIVGWGLAHRDLEGVTAIGVDEILWRRGHKYLTVVYQIDRHSKRLLWVGRDRTVKTLLRFFQQFGVERAAELKFVCSDMWKPYLKVISKKASTALHVLDRFHIAMHMNKAIDEVRAQESRDMKAAGLEPILKHSRWCLLKRPRTEPTSKTSSWPTCSSTTCGPFGAFCSRRTSSSSGSTRRPTGPVNSWMPGAGGRCDPGSSP